MEAIEFKTKVKNGTIHIPKKFKLKQGNIVKVIIISEHQVDKTDIIDKLLLNPIKSEKFLPFSREDIYERI